MPAALTLTVECDRCGRGGLTSIPVGDVMRYAEAAVPRGPETIPVDVDAVAMRVNLRTGAAACAERCG
jgi:hypothetical protein